jgi:glycosyltransferase involved in cell wall biosynthesis
VERIRNRPISLSVFFPCYNEEANVVRTTEAAVEACRKIANDFEIIIVDDGSRDRTGQLADELAGRFHEVRVVHNHPNLGYGGALQRGFREASKEWVFYTDGDGQFDFNEIPRLFPLLDRYDIVSGYRMNRQDSFIRKVNAFCWGVLVRTLLRFHVKDVDCSFKIYPRRLFEEIEMTCLGAMIDTEILVKATRLGYRIGQLGVHHYPRTAGQPTGANPQVIIKAFKELVSLYRRLRTDGPARARQP